MTWDEICEDPNLRDLPFKIETNQRGQIIMSPARSRHGEYQHEVGVLLRQLLPHGRVVIECPIQTTAGVRVPDVAWTSPARRQPVLYTLAPEICVEVLSPYNDEQEMAEKRALHLAAGALESWTCAEDGAMTFYNSGGRLAGSAFARPSRRGWKSDQPAWDAPAFLKRSGPRTSVRRRRRFSTRRPLS